MKHLKIICPITCFPSDNKIEKGKLADRIRLKNAIKRDAVILTAKWLADNNMRGFNPPVFGFAEVILTVFYKDKRRRDVHNLSVKVFLDSLVDCGLIEDDNINFIPKATLQFGGFAKESYAVFEIREI